MDERYNNDEPHALNDEFTLEELNEALKNFLGKAKGKDRIPSLMLVNLSTENQKSLLRLLNLSYSTRFIPPEWKIAIVVSFLKAGKPTN